MRQVIEMISRVCRKESIDHLGAREFIFFKAKL